MAKKMKDTAGRICPVCGTVYYQGKTEGKTVFNHRVGCSRKCGCIAAAKTRAKVDPGRPAAPLADGIPLHLFGRIMARRVADRAAWLSGLWTDSAVEVRG